jgi:RNA polymerase-binding protein DksA
MDTRTLENFRRLLLGQRQALFREVAHLEADLQEIVADRESEFEESAQEERAARLLARLDDRGKAELQEIERALFRIAKRRYGTCEGCGKPIPRGRLAALPATPYCRDCAQRVEEGEPLELEPEEASRSGTVPPDYSLLTGRELGEVIREQLRDDGRVDVDELRIVCRRGVVYLDGAVPSAAEHQILLQTVTDVMGLNEVVDRVKVQEILWQREDRDREEATAEAKPWEERGGTEDVAESQEEGVEFEAPIRPVPDEE